MFVITTLLVVIVQSWNFCDKRQQAHVIYLTVMLVKSNKLARKLKPQSNNNMKSSCMR